MSVITLGLLPFDLVGIIACAVELGMCIHDESDGMASQTADIAAERLRAVLNPRGAKFPSNFQWDEWEVMRGAGLTWRGSAEPRPGWCQEIDLAAASATARRALMTIGLAVADLRGSEQWRDRGWSLLRAGTWNLWTGMDGPDRRRARPLLSETHRIWGWPNKPGGVPSRFQGPHASLAEYRVLSPDWRTETGIDLQEKAQALIRTENYLVDAMCFSRPDQHGPFYQFAWYRHDCLPAPGTRPSICPKADPKPPVTLMAEGQLLAEMERSFRRLGLIGVDQTIHWVGRQRTPATICTCDLSGHSLTAPEPADGSSVVAEVVSEFRSTSELARQLEQPTARVEGFLRRYRGKHGDCYIRVAMPRRGESQYLYRFADVWPVLQDQLRIWRAPAD
jgi:hypothetical protein